MKDEKNLYEIPDDMLENISGGGLTENEHQSLIGYARHMAMMLRDKVIDREEYDRYGRMASYYVKYVNKLKELGLYTEEVLINFSDNWFDKLCRLERNS